MALDDKFGPVTGDLVRDGKGSFVLVDTAATALQEQVLHHYQEWWGLHRRARGGMTSARSAATT